MSAVSKEFVDWLEAMEAAQRSADWEEAASCATRALCTAPRERKRELAQLGALFALKAEREQSAEA